MRISLLDRANNVVGCPDSGVLRQIVDRARLAEDLGYHRFLVAEHHGVPGIAGSAPTVLAAAVGQATQSIRVGTAGVMLPDHVPFVVAEQVAVLESLYPGRVDIGIGSSAGFTAPVRRALRQDEDASAARQGYLDALDELLGYLRGTAPVTLRPTLHSCPRVYLLSGGSPETVAAARGRGLGLILGGPGAVGAASDVAGGRAIVSAPVAVAATREEARGLVLPEVWAQVLSRTTGSFGALRPVEELDEADLTAQQRRRVARGLEATIHGTPDEVAAELTALEQRGVGEVLVTGGMSDLDGQRRSDGLIAGAAGSGTS